MTMKIKINESGKRTSLFDKTRGYSFILVIITSLGTLDAVREATMRNIQLLFVFPSNCSNCSTTGAQHRCHVNYCHQLRTLAAQGDF